MNIACSEIAAVCGGASRIFTSNGSFIVPANVSSLTVVAIGGGGGGTNGHMPGGGGGYVECGTFSVIGGTTIPVTVGVSDFSTEAPGGEIPPWLEFFPPGKISFKCYTSLAFFKTKKIDNSSYYY